MKTTSSHKKSSSHRPLNFKQVESRISSVIRDQFGEEAGDYSEQAIDWMKKNPAAATTFAIVGALATGLLIKQFFQEEKKRITH